jgi:putative nucleotidyltransferase with HDIG domain
LKARHPRPNQPLSQGEVRKIANELAEKVVDDLEAINPPWIDGLAIRRRSESLERVASKSGEICLLSSAHGTEVMEGTLHKGKRMALESTGQALETYYLLEGSLRCDLPSGSVTLTPGDYLVTQQLTTPIIMLAKTEARFLYVTSQPVFHEISQILSELMRLSVEVEIMDGYTADHCQRLRQLSYATGEELGLSQAKLHLLNFGAYLHDVGKIKVPVEILQKPMALTPEELEIIKKHSIYGRELLEKTYMKEAGPTVEQHHERLDGSGYPYGLAGDEILLEAAIVAVADTYDAITTDRPYRRAASPEVALAEIKKYADRHYPVEVVEAFIKAVSRLEGTDGEES